MQPNDMGAAVRQRVFRPFMRAVRRYPTAAQCVRMLGMRTTTDLRPDPASIPALEAARCELPDQLDLVSCRYEAWPFDTVLRISERDRALDIADRCVTALVDRLTEGASSWPM